MLLPGLSIFINIFFFLKSRLKTSIYLLFGLLIMIIPFAVYSQSSPAAIRENLQNVLDAGLNTYGIKGAALTIVLPGDDSFTLTSGIATGAADPVDTVRIWHWASCTKPLAGFVALQMIEEGLLNINDPVGKYLDTNSIPNVDSAITIKELLQHTSGLNEVWSEQGVPDLWQAVWANRDSVWQPDQVLSYIPGPSDTKAHKYASTNTYLLSFIIEAVSGKDLESVFKERIFNPLGMESSYLSSAKSFDISEINGVWNGAENRSDWPHTSYLSSRSGNSALISSPMDVAKFYRKYYKDELLSKETMDSLRVIVADSRIPFGVFNGVKVSQAGHGYDTEIFELVLANNDTIIAYGHGGDGVSNSIAVHWLKEDITFILVVNDLTAHRTGRFAKLLVDVVNELNNNLWHPGTVYERSFLHDQNMRTYLLYVPADYDGSEKWPLVINYHGYTGDASEQMDRVKMNILADTSRFIIAYPHGLEIQIPSGILPAFVPMSGTGWCVPGFSSQYDDISFTDSLINHVMNDYSIDEHRIHTTGISLGSYMAFWAASQLPSKIASVAGVAGHMTNQVMQNFHLERPASALFIHGTDDKLTFFNGLEDYYPSVQSAVSLLVSENACSKDSIVTALPDSDPSDNSTVTLIKYSDGADSTEVLFYLVNGGGHRWPGSGLTNLPEILGNNNNDINASSEILNFFKRNPQRGLSTAIDDLSDKPTGFRLKQNFPNPFNPQTTIKYQLNKAGHVQLNVYNVLGELVAQLVLAQQQAGNYSAMFNAANLGSGLYFYQLRVNGSVIDTRKMTLLK